jgi:hypothetical protein
VSLVFHDQTKDISEQLAELEEVLSYRGLDRRHIEPKVYRNYRLAQVADMVCCIELTAARIKNNLAGRNELAFFGSGREFKKAYLKPLRKKLL